MAEQRMQWSAPEIAGQTPQIKNQFSAAAML